MKNNDLRQTNVPHYRIAKRLADGKAFVLIGKLPDYDGSEYGHVNDDCFTKKAEADLEAETLNRLPMLTPCCGAIPTPDLIFGDFMGLECSACDNKWDSRGTRSRWAVPVIKHIHSRDINHLREDLEASLRFALGVEYGNRVEDVNAVLVRLCSYDDSQQVLRDVKDRFGNAMFGQVTLYNLNNQTSLMGQAETLTSRSGLREIGMTVADLGWPADILSPAFVAQYPDEV